MNLDDLVGMAQPLLGPAASAAPTVRLATDDDVVRVAEVFTANPEVRAVHLMVANEDVGYVAREDFAAALAPGTLGGFGDAARAGLPGHMPLGHFVRSQPTEGTPQTDAMLMRCPVPTCTIGEVTVVRPNPWLLPRCSVHRTVTLVAVDS